MRKILEITLNVLVIVVGVAVLFALGSAYLRGPGEAPQAVSPGTQLSAVAELKLAPAKQTLLMFLRKDCHFCEESAGFYRRLEEQVNSAGNGTTLMAVFPAPGAGEDKYLESKGLKIPHCTANAFSRFSVSGTPTLILVDRSGTVKQSWVGKLPAEREEEVIRATTVPGS
jgi:thioredoxin-related protein